jgi:hypothetical protein
MGCTWPFWRDLEKVLTNNPTVARGDAVMTEQAKALVTLEKSDPKWQALLDQEVVDADVSLHASAR